MCKKIDKEIILSRIMSMLLLYNKESAGLCPRFLSQIPERETTSLEFPDSSICYS